MPALRGVEPDPRDAVEVGQGRVQGLEGRRLVEVAEEAHDEPRGESEPCLGVVERAPDAPDHGRERDAAVGVGLGVEEDLGVTHPLGVGAGKVGEREVEKVLLLEENAGPRVVDVEEVLEVREGVGRPHLFDGGIGQARSVALRNREHQVGFERALDVQVQLRLRQGGDEVTDPGVVSGGAARGLVVHGVGSGWPPPILRFVAPPDNRARPAGGARFG